MAADSELGKCVCVGVAGGSCSGKSTLVKRLAAEFAGTAVAILPQDNYYLDNSFLSAQQRANLNFDHPNSIDSADLAADLAELKSGNSVTGPKYDFVTHTRNGTTDLGPARLVLVDGTLVLHWPEVRDLLDLKILVSAPEQLRIARRIERDTRERGRTAESVLRQFEATVRPMHLEFVDAQAAFCDCHLAGDDIEHLDIAQLVERISGLVASLEV